MAELIRSANAVWYGDSRSGNGKISAPSGVLQDVPYTWLARFENEPGTNPEELIAAAYAACFSMAFASTLKKKGFTPEKLETQATLTMEKEDIGWTTKKMRLVVNGKVPNLDAAQFQQIAEEAEKGCPISRLLRPGLEEVEIVATLK